MSQSDVRITLDPYSPATPQTPRRTCCSGYSKVKDRAGTRLTGEDRSGASRLLISFSELHVSKTTPPVFPRSAQSTKKTFGGPSAQTHTWGGGGSCAHLRNHQPAQPFIQDPAMPPLPPPNTLAQLEEACRRLEEVSTKPSKQRYRNRVCPHRGLQTFWFRMFGSRRSTFLLFFSRHLLSGIQRDKSHQVSVQGGGPVPLFVASPNLVVLNSSGFSLQSEEYDSPSFLPSAPPPPHFSVLRPFYVFFLVTCLQLCNLCSLMFSKHTQAAWSLYEPFHTFVYQFVCVFSVCMVTFS